MFCTEVHFLVGLSAKLNFKVNTELTTFQTPIGWCAMVGRGDLLQALTFGHRSADAAVNWLDVTIVRDSKQTNRWNRTLAERITFVLDGEPDNLRDVAVDLSHLTPFAIRVVKACRRVSWGDTATYKQLAEAAGSSGAARAVGHVMSSNRTPLVVPCHRVVASGGHLGGFSAPQGLAMKRRLLDQESAIVCR